MPDGTGTDVLFTLRLQDEASKAIKDASANTKDLGANAKAAQKEFDALAEAQKRLKAADQNRQVQQVQREMERQRQMSMPWYARSVLPGGIGQLASAAAPYAAAGYAAHQIARGTSAAIGEIGRLQADRLRSTGGRVSDDEAAQLLIKNLTEAVPIIGSVSRELTGLANASRTAHAQLALASVEVQQRIGERAIQYVTARGDANREQYGIRLGILDAEAQARASAGFSAGLSPDRLAVYRGPFGDAARGVDQATAAVQAAREQAESRRAGLPAAYGAADRSSLNLSRAIKERNDAQAEADAASQERNRSNPGILFKVGQWLGGRAPDPQRLAAEKETQALRNAESEVVKSKMAEAKFAADAANLQQRLNDSKAAELRLNQAKLALDQAQLAARSQIAQGHEGRAMQYGMGTPSQAAEDAQLLKIFRQRGADVLTPEQNARVFQLAPQETARDFRRRGQRIGAGVEEEINLMRPKDQQEFGRKGVDEQLDDLEKLKAKAVENSDARAAAFTKEMGEKISDIVEKRVRQVIAAFEADQDSKRQSGTMIRNAGAG